MNNTRFGRRKFLQVGGIGVFGLGLPELLRAGAASSGRRGPERSCIFIVQYGGASHIDSLDPKPEAPEDIRGPYRPIATAVPGVALLTPLYFLNAGIKGYATALWSGRRGTTGLCAGLYP